MFWHERASDFYSWYFRHGLQDRRGGWKTLQLLQKACSLVPIHYDAALAPVWVDLRHANAEIVRMLETHHLDEAHMQRWFRGLIRPGDTVVDVGANIGVHSVLFDHLAASVHACEPHPFVLPGLRRTVAALAHTTLHECACSDRDGTATFSLEQDHTGGHLSETGVSVPARTLDGILAGRPVDFIKVDVEGFEETVFRGARATIAKYLPVIVFEQLERAGARAHDELSQFPYQFYVLTREGGIEPWSTRHPWCDVLALPPGRALP